ncbi:MAG: hypothetical protein OSB42_10415 [Planctomycetota bacterium]|nr:hypothetical protein [Planctomycetota bacterium]
MRTRTFGPSVGRGVRRVLENHLDICMPLDLASWIVGAPVNFDCTASDRVLCQL